MANLLRRAIQQSISDAFDLAKTFATTLYTGNGGTQAIVSGLDFTTEGLAWIKNRGGTNGTNAHNLVDTVRGASGNLVSDTTAAEVITGRVSSFNNDGFTVENYGVVNTTGDLYVAWQFMKAKGFLDIVEYTGDGVAGRTVALDLDDGSAVFGMSIVKNLDSVQNWSVQHKSLGGTKALNLNHSYASGTFIDYWNNTAATTTGLTLGNIPATNGNGNRFISYNFAHNPTKGIFCGSYTGTGAAGNKITTGFPVGWVMVKRTSGTADWCILDVSRGMAGATQPYLRANTTAAEASTSFVVTETDGFTVNLTGADANGLGDNYIFMAIADPAQF